MASLLLLLVYFSWFKVNFTFHYFNHCFFVKPSLYSHPLKKLTIKKKVIKVKSNQTWTLDKLEQVISDCDRSEVYGLITSDCDRTAVHGLVTVKTVHNVTSFILEGK